MFAVVGSLGTEVNLATRPYLNARKVPQILNATGRNRIGARLEQVPVDGRLAARLRVRGPASTARRSPTTARTPRSRCSTRTTATATDYMRGLKTGLGAKTSNIAAKEPYEVTAADVRTQVAKLRGSGATVFVIFATPRFTIQAYAIANALRWSPAVIYTNSVSATDAILTLAKSSGGGDLPEPDFHRPVREGPGEPRLGQRRGDEALQAGDGEVQARRQRHRRAQLLRGLGRRGVRRADVQGGEEPDAGLADEGATAAGTSSTRSFFRATGRRRGATTSSRSSASGSSKFTDGTFVPVSKLKCDTPT